LSTASPSNLTPLCSAWLVRPQQTFPFLVYSVVLSSVFAVIDFPFVQSDLLFCADLHLCPLPLRLMFTPAPLEIPIINGCLSRHPKQFTPFPSFGVKLSAHRGMTNLLFVTRPSSFYTHVFPEPFPTRRSGSCVCSCFSSGSSPPKGPLLPPAPHPISVLTPCPTTHAPLLTGPPQAPCFHRFPLLSRLLPYDRSPLHSVCPIHPRIISFLI